MPLRFRHKTERDGNKHVVNCISHGRNFLWSTHNKVMTCKFTLHSFIGLVEYNSQQLATFAISWKKRVNGYSCCVSMTISFITFDRNLNHLVRSPSKNYISRLPKKWLRHLRHDRNVHENVCLCYRSVVCCQNWPRSICIMLSLNGWRVAFTQQFMPERKNLARKKMLNYRCKNRFESNKFPGASLNGFAEKNEKNKTSRSRTQTRTTCSATCLMISYKWAIFIARKLLKKNHKTTTICRS